MVDAILAVVDWYAEDDGAFTNFCKLFVVCILFAVFVIALFFYLPVRWYRIGRHELELESERDAIDW